MKQKELFTESKIKNTCGEPQFKQTNWLISASLVGLLKVLKENEKPIEDYVEGKTVKIPQEVWKELPKLYAEYIWKITNGRSSTVFGLIKTFYNNSPLAQIFQKNPAQTLKNVSELDTKREDIKIYLSTLRDKNGFKNLKEELLEFDPKFVDKEFITFAVKEKVLNKLQELEEVLENASKKELRKILELIEKLNKKGKEANQKVISKAIEKELRKILEYQCDKNAPTCRFCFTRSAYIVKKRGRRKNFYNILEEIHFTPLFASVDTLENFFYDGKNSLFLCPYCEFLLYFAIFGFNKTPSGNYLFVYVPSDVLTTLELNELLQNKEYLSREYIKESLTEIAKRLEEERSEWLLSNIFFVEIEFIKDKRGRKTNTANVYTFHIPIKVAKVIRDLPEKFPKVLNPIFDIFLDYTFSGKSLYHLLLFLISYYFQKVEQIKGNSFTERVIKTAKYLRSEIKNLPYGLTFLIFFEELLKEGLDMATAIEKQINWSFAKGKKVREALKSLYPDRFDKKIETASFRLLEAIRRRDIDAFAQNLIRLYLDIKKPIPKLFVDALNDKGFNRIAYAFLIGLNNDREPKEEQNDGQPNEDEGTT